MALLHSFCSCRVVERSLPTRSQRPPRQVPSFRRSRIQASPGGTEDMIPRSGEQDQGRSEPGSLVAATGDQSLSPGTTLA